MATVDDLKDLRLQYLANEERIYVGQNWNPNTKVHWEQDDKARVLVNGIETDETRKMKIEGESVIWTPATLTIVAQITENDFWATSDGNWRGPTTYTKSFADLKLSFVGAIPDASTHASVFTDDWGPALTALEKIQNMTETSGFEKKQGFIVADGGRKKLKFKHGLFVPHSPDDDDATSEPDAWSLDKWPATTDEGGNALFHMREAKTHDILPLPAYDDGGNLLKPSDYKKSLRGATALIAFHLTHWTINESKNKKGEGDGKKSDGKKVDTYTANIEDVRILLPPPPSYVAATPKKRKPAKTLTEASSSKKTKTSTT